jgi:hypothetical protein
VPSLATYVEFSNETKQSFLKNEKLCLKVSNRNNYLLKELDWFLNPITFKEEMDLILLAF